MSIQSEITRISGNVSDALTAIAAKGVTVPSGSNSDDLATLIGQITSGGGATNVFTGSFTASSTVGTADTFVIPYTGTGHIIALFIWIDGGFSGNAAWNTLVQIRTIGVWYGVKSIAGTAPNYTSNSANESTTRHFYYKSSASDAAAYNNTSATGVRTYWDSNASYAAANVIKIKNATTVTYYIRDPSDTTTSRYGFWAGAKYNYVAVYSS